MKSRIYRHWCIAAAMLAMAAGCRKDASPVGLGTSLEGRLSRYDLIASDYDVQPSTSFTASYDAAGRMVNLFEKAGQTLYSFNLIYSGDRLVKSLANDKSTQDITYDGAGKPAVVNYTTLTDTGKLVYFYDMAGHLVAMLDSVKKPLKLPVRFMYEYTYDADFSNVVKIAKNELDLQGRATLRQYSFYTFDDKPNPFLSYPFLQYSTLLPGETPALVNRNNITSARLVGMIVNPSSGGSLPVMDTIGIYQMVRTYEYNDKGFPSRTEEQFYNIQFNHSGNRTFKYEY